MSLINLTDFLSIIDDLRYCPICAWKLVQHASNSAIRVCPNHGNVFTVVQTTQGYQILTDLADVSEPVVEKVKEGFRMRVGDPGE